MSDTERSNRLDETLASLGRSVETLRSTDAWQAMLRSQARFHTYSLHNQLLIAMQMPTATRVAGYRTWQSMGRQVLKGQKSLKIFGPMVGKDKETGEQKLRGFKLLSVFDISQTEGDPLPEVEWPTCDTAPDDIWDTVLHLVGGLGFEVRVHVDGTQPKLGSRGWWQPGTNVLNIVRRDPEPGMAATAIHEVAHALDDGLSAGTRAEGELVAESVAYIVGGHLGMGVTPEVEHYLASWKGDAATLLSLTGRIKVIVDKMGVLEDGDASVPGEGVSVDAPI